MDERTENLLNEYLDGTLDASHQDEAERLLAESEEAQAYLADLELLFADLADLEELPLARDLSQDIVAQLDKPTAAWSNWWLVGQIIGVAVLLLFAWPMLQMSWFELETAVSLPTSTFSLDFISQFWQQLNDNLTAVSTTSSNLPGLGLGPVQLTWLLASTFLIWILSNSYLLRNDSE